MTASDSSSSSAVGPVHIAVVMDGNGRWAKKRGFSRLEGHRRGVENVRTMVENCVRHEVPYLTLFAFSSENWRRPKKEVAWLMRLLDGALDREVKTLHSNGVRLRFIGDLASLTASIQRKIHQACQLTRENSTLNLTIALNYGGQWDLVQAFRRVLMAVQRGEICPDNLSAQLIAENLSTAQTPNPDLFIRTGGEQRVSNFLLWQLAYTELYFTDTYWPDFGTKEFELALESFATRERRFGGAEHDAIEMEVEDVHA